MNRRILHTVVTVLLVTAHAGLVTSVPATLLCSASQPSGRCACGMECCLTDGPVTGSQPIIRDAPCCSLQEADQALQKALLSDKSLLSSITRITHESPAPASVPPAAIGSATHLAGSSKIPCVTTASIPLLNSSLLI
jgi:hypothetical protein